MHVAEGHDTGRIEGWRDAGDHFRAAMAVLAASPVDVWVADRDFVHWPLGERSVMAAWHKWAVTGGRKRLTLLGEDFDALPRHHPRWAQWRGTWSHRITCLKAPETLRDDVHPTLLLDGVIGLQILDSRHGTGLWSRDKARLASWQAELDVILQRSSEALPPTTLGL